MSSFEIRFPPLHQVRWYCAHCGRWIDSRDVTSDQVHDRAAGGCGEFMHIVERRPALRLQEAANAR